MGMLDRLRGAVTRSGASARAMTSGNTGTRDLAPWVRAHTGVEGYVEPETTVTDVTVVLVASDGEWTRRIVGERGARRLSAELGIPVYDVGRTGYPQRMRDYDARRRAERRRAFEDDLRDL